MIWCLAFSNLFTCSNFLLLSDLMSSLFQSVYLLHLSWRSLASLVSLATIAAILSGEKMWRVTRSLESVTVMRRPSICFHPGVQAVNEWQLDRKTDTDRPDSGASRPLAKRQHQLFGVYHQSINQGGALSICDMSTSILILKEPNISLIFILGRFF